MAKRFDVRAPNKPLLLLYALGQFMKGHKLIPYESTHPKLRELLIEYGPPVKNDVTTEDPFVRLKNDGLWRVTPDIDHRKISRKVLKELNVHGGFTDQILDLFENEPSIIQEVAGALLERNFPKTYHDELLAKVGLDIGVRIYRKRDSTFRRKVLEAYEEQCAVCGFQAKVNDSVVGVEAAHIKWHQAYGPDTEENGLALCSLHHKLFDKGIFTVRPDRKIEVSQLAIGSGMFKEMVTDFHQKNIRTPSSHLYLPNKEFTDWHIQEVYKEYYK